MIDFNEEHHIYRLDGEIIPSVSTVLKFIFPDKYTGVPKFVMQEAAEFGTKVHKAVEMTELYQMKPDDALKWVTGVYERLCLEKYFKIKDENKFEVLEQEQIVFTENYAGRFDMIVKIGDKKYLADIKTTAELDVDYLSWQLSLYEYAYGKVDGLVAIWLPKKELGKLEHIERKTKKEIEEVLKMFKEGKDGTTKSDTKN